MSIIMRFQCILNVLKFVSDLLVKCQVIVNYSSQVCWILVSEFARAVAADRKRKKMTNSMDVECRMVKEKQRLFKLWKGPKKCRIGCR